MGILDRATPYDWHLTMLDQERGTPLFNLLEEQLCKYKHFMYHSDQQCIFMEENTERVIGRSFKNKHKVHDSDKQGTGGEKKYSKDSKFPKCCKCCKCCRFGRIGHKCPHPQNTQGGYT
jgi:hypothetical protein